MWSVQTKQGSSKAESSLPISLTSRWLLIRPMYPTHQVWFVQSTTEKPSILYAGILLTTQWSCLVWGGHLFSSEATFQGHWNMYFQLWFFVRLLQSIKRHQAAVLLLTQPFHDCSQTSGDSGKGFQRHTGNHAGRQGAANFTVCRRRHLFLEESAIAQTFTTATTHVCNCARLAYQLPEVTPTFAWPSPRPAERTSEYTGQRSSHNLRNNLQKSNFWRPTIWTQLGIQWIITDFFWNGKIGKVRYNLLLQDILDGGIKLPDLATRIRTIHLYLIKFLWSHPESTMASVLTKLTAYNNIQDLLRCKRNLAERLDKKWTFLTQILNTWAQLHFQEPISEDDVQKEMLWDNKYIQINKKTIFFDKVERPRHRIYKWPSSCWRTKIFFHTELAGKYDLPVSFLEILQVRSAIPCNWKKKILNPATQDLSSKITICTKEGLRLDIPDKTSKVLYSALVKELVPKVTSQGKWNEIFPRHETDANDYWAGIYKSPYQVTRDTKLQASHFRVIHRFLPCNKFLHNMHIRRDDNCNFCQESDTIEHFL